MPSRRAATFTHDRVTEPIGRADVAGEDVATIDAASNAVGQLPLGTPSLICRVHSTNSPQAARTGLQGAIGLLMKRAPECHHAVANELVDGSAFGNERLRNLLEVVRFSCPMKSSTGVRMMAWRDEPPPVGRRRRKHLSLRRFSTTEKRSDPSCRPAQAGRPRESAKCALAETCKKIERVFMLRSKF